MRKDEQDKDCPGEGKCHGLVCWCMVCGDVEHVCDKVDDCSGHKERRSEQPWRYK